MYKQHLYGGVNPQRYKGFTLAEVLVTLAVIGIVASLTIPSLMKSYEKQQWISGYKETYSIISQATKMIEADNGGTLIGAWSFGTNDESGIYNAYKPYLKASKDCGLVGGHMTYGCYASSYKNLSGNGYPISGYNSLILTNGASVAFNAGIGRDYIYIDTNGLKGPNVRGKDLHLLVVNSNGVKPDVWWYHSSREIGCPSNLSSGDGSTCGYRIMYGDYAEDY